MADSRELDLTTLSAQQLDQLKKTLEKDIEALTANFQQLKEAEARFKESVSALSAIPEDGAGREIMVPLTSSLYVPGRLGDTDEVLVDIGTGFYVGKTAKQASELLAKKADRVKHNTDGLMKFIVQKQQNLGAVTEVLEERLAQMQQAQQMAGAGGGSGGPRAASYASAAAAAAGR